MPKLAKQSEPVNLDRIKAAVQARWGTVDLLDVLTEADRHVGLLDCFPSVATRAAMPPDVLRERLLLVLFALGTNTGIKQVAGGEHGHGEAALRHVRRLHVTGDNVRRATVKLVNATLASRDPALWGSGTASPPMTPSSSPITRWSTGCGGCGSCGTHRRAAGQPAQRGAAARQHHGPANAERPYAGI